MICGALQPETLHRRRPRSGDAAAAPKKKEVEESAEDKAARELAEMKKSQPDGIATDGGALCFQERWRRPFMHILLLVLSVFIGFHVIWVLLIRYCRSWPLPTPFRRS